MPTQRKRWPNGAEDSRLAALLAAKEIVKTVIDAVNALGHGDILAALRGLKHIYTLAAYIEETLIAGKYGESPEPLPKENNDGHQ